MTHVPDGPRHIRAFDVGADGALSGGEVFATCTDGHLRRLPLRHRRAPVDERRRRRALLRPRRHAAGQGARPRGRRQRRLRRPQAQPPVHLRDDLAVLGDAGRQRRRAPARRARCRPRGSTSSTTAPTSRAGRRSRGCARCRRRSSARWRRSCAARWRLTVAGRTDRGVHAWGQVASYEGEPADARALNAVLPDDVAVLACAAAPDGFDARRDARSRTYCYRLLTRRALLAVRARARAVVAAAARRRGAAGVRGGAARHARLHRLHADADRARALRARRPRRALGARRRHPRVLDHGRHLHAPHEPRAGGHDARGGHAAPARWSRSRRCSPGARGPRPATPPRRTGSTWPRSPTECQGSHAPRNRGAVRWFAHRMPRRLCAPARRRRRVPRRRPCRRSGADGRPRGHRRPVGRDVRPAGLPAREAQAGALLHRVERDGQHAPPGSRPGRSCSAPAATASRCCCTSPATRS